MSIARRQRWLSRGGIAAAFLLVTASPLHAQIQPRARPQQAAARSARATLVTSVEGITEYALPNGLKVLLFPDNSKATVTVNITYYVGSRQEGYGETGMAHLLEHLLFKGSKNHPEIYQELANHGARRNGTTNVDRTNYYETVPANDANLEWALDLEADRMVNSFVAKKDLESEFSVVRNEMELWDTDPNDVVLRRALRAAFRWHAYGRPEGGTRSDIENVPIERLQAFYKRYYQPDNAILVVAGKFDAPATLSLIERKFGAIPRPKRSHELGNLLYPSYTVEPTQEGEQFVTVRRAGDAQVVMTAYHVPGGTHPDHAVADVLSDVLGSNPSGRLFKAIVDTKAAANLVGGVVVYGDPTVLVFRASVRADQSIDSVRAMMERHVEAARTGTFTAEEVDRAKASLLRNIDLQFNNSGSIGITLSEWAAMGDWRLFFLHRDRIEKTTPADVQRVAAAYLKPSNRTTVVYVPTAQPDRAEIPPKANVAAQLAGYKGRAVVQAGEVFDASPKNIDARTKRATLPSGMHVTMVPKLTRGNRVLVMVQLRQGTEESLAGKGQVATITTGMLSRGTTSLTRQQVIDSLSKLKANVSIGGAGNGTVAAVETTRPNLLPVLELVAQQLRFPRLDPEELDKLKKERLAALEAAKSQPQNLAVVTANKKVVQKPKGHPLYVSSADETIAEINAVSAEAVKAFHQTYFGASFADMAIVGDFDVAEVTAAVTKHFGDWKNSQPFARIVRTYTRTDSSFESIETPDKANAFFYAATTVELKDDDPDYPAFLVAQYMLGGTASSRITARLRGKEGISYSATAVGNVQAQDRYGTWTASAILAPQNVERLQQAFRQELDSALKHGFTVQEVEQYRAGFLQGRSQSRANDNELVAFLISRRYTGRTMMYDEDLDKKIAALTPDQINAALRKHLNPKNIVLVRAGDFAKNPPVRATP